MPIKLGLSTNEEWLIPPFLVKNVIDPTQPKPSHCTVGDLNKFLVSFLPQMFPLNLGIKRIFANNDKY